MITLGSILLVIGIIFKGIQSLIVIGAALLSIGLILAALGATGRAIADVATASDEISVPVTTSIAAERAAGAPRPAPS